jgi:hypothetical protein
MHKLKLAARMPATHRRPSLSFSLVTLISLLILLCSCASVGINDIDIADGSGVPSGPVQSQLNNGLPQFENDGALKRYFESDPDDVAEFIESECGAQKVIAPAIVALISSVGKLLFDLYVDKQIKATEDLKKAAQRSYSARSFTTVDELKKSRCIAILRQSAGDATSSSPDTGLIAIARLKPMGESSTGFVLTPVFVKANSAVAVTARPAANNGQSAAPLISLTLAISIKTLGLRQHTGSPQLVSIGEGVVTIPKVEIGIDGEPMTCNKNCPTSDLIPYPADASQPVSITIAVTESGHLGIDLDERAAQIKAIKESLGPAISEGITSTLSEEE